MNLLTTPVFFSAAALSVSCLLPGAAQAALEPVASVFGRLHAAAAPAPAQGVDAALAVLDGAQGAAGERAYRLAVATAPVTARLDATALAIGSRTRPTASTLSLWAFITTVRAQQSGERFVILEANTSLLQLAEGPAAPVPLPAAAWLMLAGLLGIAGTTGVRVQRRVHPGAAT